MKTKANTTVKAGSSGSLSALLRNASAEERNRLFRTVIDEANASQRKVIDTARQKSCCVA